MLSRRFAWIMRRSQDHPDFKLKSFIYEHDTLVSKIVHLESKDKFKVFSSLFRTTPIDRTEPLNEVMHEELIMELGLE